MKIFRTNKAQPIYVDERHIFNSTAERDTYFLNNPHELKDGLYIIIQGTLYYRFLDQWYEQNVLLSGPKGDIGPKGAKGDKGDKGDRGEVGPKGDKPAHEWSGTSLRLENPDGSWGELVDLRGVGIIPGGMEGQVLVKSSSNDYDIKWIDFIPTPSWDNIIDKPSVFPPSTHRHDDLYEPKNANIQKHISNQSNPHNVTKSDVGLGNVENYSMATQSEAELGIAEDRYMNPLGVRRAIEKFLPTPSWDDITQKPTAFPPILGEDSKTAFRGDWGLVAYMHSQSEHAPVDAQKNSDITKAEIEAKLTGPVTSHTHNYLPLSGGSISGDVNVGGNLVASRVFNAVYNDYAEYFLKDEDMEAGDIVQKNPNSKGYIKSRHEQSNLVVGVVSTNFAQCIGGDEGKTPDEQGEKYVPIGLSGRVPVKVVGRVKPGDLIVSSHIVGVGMSSEEYIPGTVVGKALESHNSDEVGKIDILIMNM